MKKLTDVIVNNLNQDAIIEYYSQADRVDNEIVWVNKKDYIAKCHGDARNVIIYLKDSSDYNKITAIELRASSIKKLYDEIIEIEKQTSEEFID